MQTISKTRSAITRGTFSAAAARTVCTIILYC